jgi:asparagine N-glycosylation enzyme membrane subunit Stt3
MSDPNITWYPSKVDVWLAVILALLPLVMLGTLVSSLRSGNREDIVAAAVSFVIIVGVYGLLVFPTRYGIGVDELIVRFGVIRQRIRFEKIREVAPTHNLLSSPALSFDRLVVRTGGSFFSDTMISPADREAFLSTLALRAGLWRDGDRLVRTADGRGTGPRPKGSR